MLFKDSVQVLSISYGDRSKYTRNVQSVIQADEMRPGAETLVMHSCSALGALYLPPSMLPI